MQNLGSCTSSTSTLDSYLLLSFASVFRGAVDIAAEQEEVSEEEGSVVMKAVFGFWRRRNDENKRTSEAIEYPKRFLQSSGAV